MYDAYSVSTVAKNLPLEIHSIATHGENLLAGTKNGCLLTYTLNREGGRRTFDVQMCKNFERGRRAVAQLGAVERHQLLLCLADGLVAVHDALQLNYPLTATLLRTKGATAFATLDQADTGNLYLCVVLRRRLQFYQWHERSFQESPPADLAFPDSILAVCWMDGCLLAAVRDEYFFVRVFGADAAGSDDGGGGGGGGGVQTLFTTGGVIEPLMVYMADRRAAALSRADATVFVDSAGRAARHLARVPWSEPPLALVYDAPYLLALLSKHVEVRSVQPSGCVQIIELAQAKERPRLLARSQDGSHVFVASVKELWCLATEPNLRQNVNHLVKAKEYELAIQLANMMGPEKAEEREKRLREIKHLYAFDLFCQRKFELAFKLCIEIDTEVLYVLGLFPDLLPEDTRRRVAYPTPLQDDLAPDELKLGLQALTVYLSEIRTGIAHKLERQPKLRERQQAGGALDERQLHEQRVLLEIVDTMLLKCYLETNDMLVASLLRLPDNSCNVTETEKILLRRQKFFELFLLYERRGRHQEALELLKTQANMRDSPLRGLDRTIHYLQNLGNDKLELIFKYAIWVLHDDADEGLRIFTEDCEEVRSLSREAVLNFLQRHSPVVVVNYLEHIIFQWDEDGAKFHDAIAELYITRVKRLLEECLRSLPEGHSLPPAGSETGELGELRNKLLYFLGYSLRFSPELLLVQIPHDALYEERALLLGRLRRHEQAIAIYTTILHDYKAAERYCNLHYNRADQHDSQVFLLLLRMYARPPESSILGLMHSDLPSVEPNMAQALRVLKHYAHRIDTVETVEMLSGEIKLDNLWVALEAVLQQTANWSHKVQLHKGLYHASSLHTQAQRRRVESVRVTVNNNTGCLQCGKKIANSAFSRFPDGTLVHYYCYKQMGMKPAPSLVPVRRQL